MNTHTFSFIKKAEEEEEMNSTTIMVGQDHHHAFPRWRQQQQQQQPQEALIVQDEKAVFQILNQINFQDPIVRFLCFPSRTRGGAHPTKEKGF